jgi:DNA polymerase III gamma/tau subunit
MARMKISEQDWEKLKPRLKDRTQIELAEKEASRSRKMQDIENIQYFAADLAYALDVGEIAEMWVDTENGRQILRMRVIPKKHDEFKTIRAMPKNQSKQTVKRKAPDNYKPRNKNLQFERAVPAPETGFGSKAADFGGKIGKGLVEWIRTPPRKKPEDW